MNSASATTPHPTFGTRGPMDGGRARCGPPLDATRLFKCSESGAKMPRSKKQKVPVPQPEVDDPFDTMMTALDWYFHVTTCSHHANAERTDAYHAAHESFLAFVNGDPIMDSAANAPTSEAVH